MTKPTYPQIPSSEITPKQAYLSRRDFIKAAGVIAGSMALAACGIASAENPPEASAPAPANPAQKDELGDPVNTFQDITNYNNYYEFTTDKEGVAPLSKNFKTTPWDVEVSGLVKNPRKFGVEDLVKKYQPEERIYRLRCVEAWSMVIPWVGFPLAKLLKEVEPTSDAKYVRFETLFNPDEMPGQKSVLYPWPYQEGLRLDEAMHDLTLLATGLYGGELPAQSGGGIRLVVPWKYGFKSIKAIVKIELVANEPSTLWSAIAPNEYGFYANVNPEVDHPRWSQASERRIGEFKRRETLMFNGYAEQVAGLYAGMDLSKKY
ncbi:MAG: protein-methionine-sulfoxide reductase catalytic subunit MsrP [Chloroflexi bacterium]|nr:MAG: protein-methionine-sulfoxide reductase catalytic subunit MsrP [Chloroflexota bacterium]